MSLSLEGNRRAADPKPTPFASKVMETVGPNRGRGVSGIRSGPPGLGSGEPKPTPNVFVPRDSCVKRWKCAG